MGMSRDDAFTSRRPIHATSASPIATPAAFQASSCERLPTETTITEHASSASLPGSPAPR
ncbi:MAG: hypothetical protein ABT00_02485 [Bordetella sp. SCN 68-11]|nr:MAG: hypothetical protein ABT00_02485 [Bordetella sp. SCN 68-11]